MQPMRVLDIDMDFFLSDVCELAAVGERPSEDEASPWKEADVRAFFERKCGLSRVHPLPGRVFDTHDGALWLWHEQIASGALSVPFHVTHVDAHSDLGIGRPGPAYVLESVLAQPPGRRIDLEKYVREKKLDEANYLLFALAFRWIASLKNVRNPCSRADIPAQILREAEEALRLESTLARLIPQFDYNEPMVPYAACAAKDFKAEENYQLASLAISPRYAPRKADFIAEIFREYIVEI